MTNFPDNDPLTQDAVAAHAGVLQSSQKLSSQELFRNGSTVCIEHQGENYWLRLTRGNKLILTK
jgi:hemin uptake protein HemP